MWWNRVTPWRRAASARVWVPSTLVRKNRAGSRMARLLWDSAAKLTMTSISCSARVLATTVQVADVALDEGDPVLDVGQVGPVAGVGQHVEGHHRVLGVVLDPVPDEVRADEAGAAGDEQSHDGPA